MTSLPRPKILLDCDPGVDDMFAIFTALRWCDPVALTSVAGNVGLAHTTANALTIIELAGADVPVHRGAAGPISGAPLDDAAEVHGELGLGGTDLPAPSGTVADTGAVDALFDYTAGRDVTVVAIGPLTNIALALQRDPEWVSRIPRLVIMGGSTGAGNVTAAAEFNIWADPEAAEIVFTSGVNMTMVGLNLTRQVTMGAPEIDRLRAAGSDTAMVAADALEFYTGHSFREYGVAESAMHDPCAVLEAVRPELFERTEMNVAIETGGNHCRGMTLCDSRRNAAEPNVDVLVRAKSAAVVDAIMEATINPLG